MGTEAPRAQKMGTKPLGRGAVDYDAVAAPKGRHSLPGGQVPSMSKGAEDGRRPGGAEDGNQAPGKGRGRL